MESNSCARGSMMSLSIRVKTVRGGRSPTLAISMLRSSPTCIAQSTGVFALDALGFRNRRAQTDREIVGEMIAADGNRTRVANHAADEKDQVRAAAADIEQAAAEFALILSERGFRGSERLQNCIADDDAGAIRGSDQILRGGNRGRNDVNVDFETLPNHADGIAECSANRAENPAEGRGGFRGLREE